MTYLCYNKRGSLVTKNTLNCTFQSPKIIFPSMEARGIPKGTRLRVVTHFSSGIVERAKRERA